MGGVCSAGTRGEDNKVEGKTDSRKARSLNNPGGNLDGFEKRQHKRNSRVIPSSSKPSTPANAATNKVPQKSSLFGRAGIVGLERAVDVLDTLGSSMSNLNSGHSFVSGVISRGKRVSILAFEVANTIAKGGNLLQSLSEDNIRFLKNDVVYSEGVQKLVSTDFKELLSIAAADKRNDLDVFSKEVIRFGDLCKDPQWHNLGRYFSKLDMVDSVDLIDKRKVEADKAIQGLTAMAQHTAELYHELDTLGRFELDYKRKLDEVASLNLPKKGESLMILHGELKQQRKIVHSLKRKSLWSKTMEEIVEKLVDVVTYMHQAMFEAFGDTESVKKKRFDSQRLGAAGLALHYASVINQIDNIAARPAFIPANVRETLYHKLPPNVKKSLPSRLMSIDTKEKLSISEVKDEMEKTLRWLVPLASNTTRAHQGFGWVGEWANASVEFHKGSSASGNLTSLQTLNHAEKQKTDLYILELVAWLHHLVTLIRQRDNCSLPRPIVRSPTQKTIILKPFSPLECESKAQRINLSDEERNLLNNLMNCRKLNLAMSKSQEFPCGKKKASKVYALSRSTENSPQRDLNQRRSLPLQRNNMLDVMDGLALNS